MARGLAAAAAVVVLAWVYVGPVDTPLDIGKTSGAAAGGVSDSELADHRDDGDGGSNDYLSEERCQPVDDMNDPSDGVVPSPEELLPDPELCPEFYEGNPGAAPPPPVSAPPVSPGPSVGAPDPAPYDPCADPASLNGNPCVPVGDYPTYPSPDPPYPTYPADPPLPQPDY